jgi:cytochrome c-type biogenesis protein CcmH
MSRVLLVAAAAAVALAAVLTVGALRPATANRAEQARAIAAELRCPDCQALSVADSPTQAAAEIRRQIDEMLDAGRSPDEIRAHFVDRYGEWILLAPASPVAWLVPPLALAAAGALLAAWLVRRPYRAGPRTETPSTSQAARERVREEAEALDA